MPTVPTVYQHFTNRVHSQNEYRRNNADSAALSFGISGYELLNLTQLYIWIKSIESEALLRLGELEQSLHLGSTKHEY